MDRLEGLANSLSQVTMYDIKSMYNQAKNIVLNVSEMEAKVRDATNDDPWGASSTLMQEIAQGTFNFQQFNEIMPCIYSRFMEKEASQWRQIYKALQLLEYIIKHGSERVVDDARSHLSTIKMLRNFHYIDENGKDQGINVRNRSRELADLLLDLDRVRQERRKAKSNRTKYTGVGNDGMSFGGGFSGGGGGSRYGGFGNEDAGSSSGYGGGYDRDYNGGGSRSGGFSDSAGRKGYEEYDAGDDEDKSSSPVDHRRSSSLSRANLGNVALPRKASEPAPTRTAAKTTAVPAKPANVMDLLGFDAEDEAAVAPPVKAVPVTSAPVASLDDDFDDFQSATPVSAPSPTPQTTKPAGSSNVFDLLGGAPAAKPAQHTKGPSLSGSAFTMGSSAPAIQPQRNQSSFASFTQPQQPPMGMGMGMGMKSPLSPSTTAASASSPNYFGTGAPTLNPTQSSTAKPATPYATKPGTTSSSGSGAFDDLWSMGLGKPAAASKAGSGGPAKSIKDLEREKQQAAIWGSPAQGQNRAAPSAFGAFGNAAPASSGGDDLLL